MTCYNLWAQQVSSPNRSYIDVSSGLSNNYVSKIIEDDKGLKWIATEGGLNRFDGSGFRLYKPGNDYPGLENENIETVFKDSRGKIWVGTKSGGLSLYDPIEDRFTNFNQVINEEIPVRVTSIGEAPNGLIWVGTWSRGLYIIDPTNSTLKEHPFDGRVLDILVDDDEVFVVSSTSVSKWNLSGKQVQVFPKKKYIHCIVKDTVKNQYLLGGQGGVYCLDTKSGLISGRYNDYFKDKSYVTCLAFDKEGQLWIGSWGSSVYVVKPHDLPSPAKLSPDNFGVNGVNHGVILDIHIDSHNLVWIATGFAGIIKISPSNGFTNLENNLSEDESNQDHNVHAFHVDRYGRYWSGRNRGGIWFSEHQASFKKVELKPYPLKVNAFLEVSDYLLVGTSRGLFIAKLVRGKMMFERISSPQYKVMVLHYDDQGYLWIGTQQNGLAVINSEIIFSGKDTNRLERANWFDTDLTGERISAIEVDSTGNLWIGTYNGLFLYNPLYNRFTHHNDLFKEKFLSVIIHALHPHSDGTLWAGTPSGLLHLDPKDSKVDRYDMSDGLSSDFISAVTSDFSGNLWVSTPQGISKMALDTKTFLNYGHGVGIQVGAFNINAVFRSNSLLFFGGQKGIIAFDPSRITSNTNPPEVVLTGLTVDGKLVKVGELVNDRVLITRSIVYTDEITLTHEEVVFSVHFTPNDYMDPLNITYRYQLEGAHDSWVYNANHSEITFTGLSAGTYQLKIQASRDNQHFGKARILKLRILPPIWLSWYAYAFYYLVLFIIILLIRRFSQKQTRLQSNLEIARIAKEKEHELTEAKLTFFTNISHELRTPLTLILGPVTEVLALSNVPDAIRTKLISAERNTKRLLHLISQLLDFRKSENGMLRLQVAMGDFSAFAHEIYLSFKQASESKGVELKFISENDIQLLFDRDKMEIVLCNLLSNALKYSDKGDRVVMKVESGDNECVVSVTDSGQGIPAEHLERIFDRFYQINTSKSAKIVGTGIGLTITKNIIELHHGRIEVMSKESQGTTFTVHLPFNGNSAFSESERIHNFMGSDDLERYAVSDIPTNLGDDEKDYTILLVDDNLEILHYLESILELDYHVLKAVNGKQALETASLEVPDLIVSDIMMPEMDGIALCKAVKTQISTSHIPVILLTARTSTVYEVTGLQTGADDYIKKPFNPEIVKSRIFSQLENRKKIRDYLLKKVRFEPNDSRVTDLEEQFVQRTMSLVESNVHNEDFGIESLMEEFHMSQSTLYRKIKSLTGLSITAFIRSVRLKLAASIILKEDLNLSQVAYKVGFNDYKYFKRSFKEQFGCLPSDYKEKKKVEV